jgi:hypothetical protein
MPETGHFVTSGGAVLEMDIPASRPALRPGPDGPVEVETNFAREHFDAKIRNGELRRVASEHVRKVHNAETGGYHWALTDDAVIGDPIGPVDDASAATGEADSGEDGDGAPSSEKDALLARAAELGIEVNPKWGVKRLADAIDAATGGA